MLASRFENILGDVSPTKAVLLLMTRNMQLLNVYLSLTLLLMASLYFSVVRGIMLPATGQHGDRREEGSCMGFAGTRLHGGVRALLAGFHRGRSISVEDILEDRVAAYSDLGES